ncbi:DUF1858 domain-containing protein [Polycladidibacter stylochi]|uniref:DUF1858 domain-containing protein n=1 Tax=Polycladidibacter stylochi TaxID=1807766 RepID=UPI000835F4F5|nr:DUF1858 domain-containing protein [Pseudovibrio stylochi]
MSLQCLDNPDMTLDRLMEQCPQTIPVFLKYKMLCVGCLVNPFHTISDACEEYKLDEQDFRCELERAITATKQ